MTERIKCELNRSEQKIVTALHQLLMELPTDNLIAFFQKIGVQMSLSVNHNSKGRHICRIFYQRIDEKTGNYETVEAYSGTSTLSPRSAIANAAARFLTLEEHDYHSYGGLHPDDDGRKLTTRRPNAAFP